MSRPQVWKDGPRNFTRISFKQRKVQVMSDLLAHCPGGNLLEPPIEVTGNHDITGFAEGLISGLTTPQREVFDDPSRFKMLCSGRRFGKTHLCLVQLIVWAAKKAGSLCWYIAPTYKAAKSIAWRQLKAMVPVELFASKNEVDLSIELVNGSRIELKGGDNSDSLRGNSISNCVLDEAAYIPRDAWEMVIRPALADQRGSAFFISTPAGYNHFHEWWETAQDQEDWNTFSYTTIQGGNVPPEEVELARRTLDERQFRQEFLASFETFSGRVFPEFGDDNIDDNIVDMEGPILVGLDFNVSIMAGVICSKVGDTLHIWDEIAVKNSNTDEVCQMLRQRFPEREIVTYPDPTGRARKTSAAGQTDHGIIKKYGMKVIAPSSPWSIKDRLQATNWLIKNAAGEIRLFIHPRCKNTIKGLRGVTFKEGAEDFVVDKDPGLEHWCDGLGYLILSAMNQVRPWKTGRSKTVRIW
jgi:phage terminase large subunit